MNGSSWWSITMITGERIYIPVGDGEQLRQFLAARQEKEHDEQLMFTEVEDVSGSPHVLRVDTIVLMYLSSPAIREQDDDPNGLLEEIRAHAQHTSAKKWDEL